MERMTRNDAAAYLGVDPQTVTNWVNKGLLGGYNDKSSKRFWVNADDVKKYSEKYKMLSVTEDLLDREQKELLASERKVNAKIQMLMHDALNVSSFSYDKIGGLLCTLLELTSQGGMREKKIMQAFFPDFDKMCTYKITYPNFQAFSKNNLCKWVTQRLFFVSLHHVCT